MGHFHPFSMAMLNNERVTLSDIKNHCFIQWLTTQYQYQIRLEHQTRWHESQVVGHFPQFLGTTWRNKWGRPTDHFRKRQVL